MQKKKRRITNIFEPLSLSVALFLHFQQLGMKRVCKALAVTSRNEAKQLLHCFEGARWKLANLAVVRIMAR